MPRASDPAVVSPKKAHGDGVAVLVRLAAVGEQVELERRPVLVPGHAVVRGELGLGIRALVGRHLIK